MLKKYIVRLTQEEHDHLHEIIKKLSGSSQKVRRAHILLKADANGPCWTDSRIEKRSTVGQKLLRTSVRILFCTAFNKHLTEKKVRRDQGRRHDFRRAHPTLRII